MATRVDDGHQFFVGVWEKPEGELGDGWQVPVGEVDALVAQTFKKYNVIRMYCDPPYWQDSIDKWSAEFGEKVVVQWWTNRSRAVVAALNRYHTAVSTGQMTHDGNEIVTRHIHNAKVKMTRDGAQIRKDRPQSPNKIDLTMAAVLAYEARGDAIEAGLNKVKKKVYKTAGF